MKKIIHYIPSIDRSCGGTTEYVRLLAEKLGQQSELHVVTHTSQHPVDMEHCQIHFVHKNIWGLMKHEWMVLLNEVKPNIVHVHGCWEPQCVWVQKWSQEKGYKVILTPHGMLEPWIMRRNYWVKKLPALILYQKKAICKADYIHATAESEKENLHLLGYNDKIKVIPNAVNVDSIIVKNSWQRTKTILFLSRIHEKKGINFLIETASILKKELDGYKIVIAGEGDAAYIDTLKQMTLQVGVQNIISFAGGVYGEEKWNLFRKADVFVLPTFSENFGIAIAEALASGTPVITTKGTPWTDLVKYKCGWHTEIGTLPTVNALKEFLQLDEMTLESMGRNGRRLIEDKYSTQSMADEMMELYRGVL
jgi:glycosyltransferase involved in cell wall biosynthesis